MLEQNSAAVARWTRVVATVLALGTAASLGACRDAVQTQDITGPSVSSNASRSQNSDRDDENEGDDDTIYEQVEFLGNPLVSEVTIVKANHDRYNRTQPYNTAEFGAQSLAFINAFRGNQPVVANTLGAVLYPDMLIVESARSTETAGWLSWALANGWGGRKLSDDVVDAGLSAIFGDIISAAGAYCPAGKLPLCTDNVRMNDRPFLATFPYLATPRL